MSTSKSSRAPTRKPAVIRHPCLLIRVNKSYRPGITPIELYDATRSAWKVGVRRKKVRYALAVFGSVVRQVYRIHTWFPAGSTFNTRRGGGRSYKRPGRHEFVGTIAPARVRSLYVNRDVGHLYRHGNRNPVKYELPAKKSASRRRVGSRHD